MENFKFWDNWELGLQRSFKFYGITLFAVAIFLFVAAWRSPAPTITWQYLQERETTEKPVHQFQTGPFSLQVSADNTIIFEKLLGNEIWVQTWPVYVYLGCVLIGLILLITILSTLSRFWFFIGSGLLIFLFTSLQLQLLYVLKQENQSATVFIMMIIIGTGLLFQYYFQEAGFFKRLLVFSLAITASFVLLAFLSKAPNPLHYIAVGFIPFSVIICGLLAIFTAHEIIALIILLITRGLKGANGFAHFLILSLIYLANLLAVYVSSLGWFHWPFSINPILLLTASTVLGVWGIRRQQDQMEGFLLRGPFGPLALMGLAIIAFGSASFFYTSGNDAALETISNLSLYAHIGYGGIFIFYVISNFGSFLRNNYPVMKALYNPSAMPFFTFRFAGTIAMLGFILYNYWKRPINDTKGARYAALADYYLVSGDLALAEGFYKKSDSYAFHNHYANYVLANLQAEQGQTTLERQYYLNAAERRPTLQAYMNAINTLDQSAINLYAYLKTVKHDFPQSGVVNNAFGLVYARLNQLDSALYYFNLARKDRLTSATAEINLLATAVKQELDLDADSIYRSLDGDTPGPLSNSFAFANSKQVTLERELKLSGDTTLNLFTASLISNYFLNRMDSLDTLVIAQAEKLARLPSNSDYFETVITACAHAYYAGGEINLAFKLMQEATVYSELQGSKNNTMALWALDQNTPTVANGYADFAVSQKYAGALLTQAVAQTEVGHHGEAVVLFDSLRKTSKVLVPVAESVQRVLLVKQNNAADLNDMEKYAFCRYRLGYEDSVQFIAITKNITDVDWLARSILDRSRKLFEWDELRDAIKVYNLLNDIALINRKLINEIQHHEMLLQAAMSNVGFLESKIKEGMIWERFRSGEKIYFEALIAEAAHDTIKANAIMKKLAKQNDFFVDGVLAAAVYTKANSKGGLEAYTILANALQANPKSVKLLKAYILEARALGFDEFAMSSGTTLQQVLPAPLFRKFSASFP